MLSHFSRYLLPYGAHGTDPAEEKAPGAEEVSVFVSMDQ